MSCFLNHARWNVKATNDLPEYMKICYLAMFNFGNEIAYNVLRDHGLNVVPYVKEEVRRTNKSSTSAQLTAVDWGMENHWQSDISESLLRQHSFSITKAN